MTIKAEELGFVDTIFQLDQDDEDVKQGHKDVIYVARQDFLEKLKNRFTMMTGSTGNPVHTVIHGSAGVGKTHTLTWIQHYCKLNKLKIKNREVDIVAFNAPTTSKNSTFSVFYSKFMVSLGKESIMTCLDEYWKKVRDELDLEKPGLSEEQKISSLNNRIRNRDLAILLVKLRGISSGTPEDTYFWNWISGTPQRPAELTTLGLSNNTPEKHSETASEVLYDFIKIIYDKAFDSKRFMLVLIDEVENMKTITNDNMHFINGIRILLGIRDILGIVFSCNSDPTGKIEFTPLEKSIIKERIGDNFLHLDLFNEDEALKFMFALFKEKRIKNYDDFFNTLKNKYSEISDDLKDTYPFLEDDLVSMITEMNDKDINLNPRNIEEKLDSKLSQFEQYKNMNPEKELSILKFDLIT